MDKYSRLGHRTRIRNTYIENGADGISDMNLLELYLSLVVPQIDVKPLAYELFNHFGSLEKIFSADIDQLTAIEGLGENTAFAISLFRDYISLAENERTHNLLDIENRKAFVKDIQNRQNKFGVYAIDSKGNLINSFYYDSINTKNAFDIINDITETSCCYILIARKGDSIITPSDASSISDLKLHLQTMNIYILDYIIVSDRNIIAVSETDKKNLVLY